MPYESEYQRWQRRERRRARMYQVLAWMVLIGTAMLMAVIGWAALVGFCVVFG